MHFFCLIHLIQVSLVKHANHFGKRVLENLQNSSFVGFDRRISSMLNVKNNQLGSYNKVYNI